MKNLQLFHRKSISKLVLFFLIINSFMFTDAIFNQSYATPTINEMNINTTDNEVSVYGTGDGNGAALADKPFRYTIGNSQSEWVRDASNMSINETLTVGTLSSTSVMNNAMQLSNLSNAALKTLTIDHTKIEANLTNFPLTVYLNSTNFDFSKTKADGSDIQFTDINLNPLKFEKEEYSVANSKAVFNVLIPNVSSTTDTQFYMWYGNPNTYNTSIESWQDQTGKQLSYNGNVKLATGIQTDKRVASFDGNGDFFAVNNVLSTNVFTFEAWVNIQDLSQQNQTLLDIGNHNTLLVSLNRSGSATGTTQVFIGNGSSWTGSFISSNQLGAGWNHIAVTCTQNGTYLFHNGVLVGSSAYTPTIAQNSRILIGSIGTAAYGEYLKGYVAGARMTAYSRYIANFTPPSKFIIDSPDVMFCSNFDTIYDSQYAAVQHMGDSLIDATGNGIKYTNVGTAVISSDFGKARSFNGNSYLLSDTKLPEGIGLTYSIIGLMKANPRGVLVSQGVPGAWAFEFGKSNTGYATLASYTIYKDWVINSTNTPIGTDYTAMASRITLYGNFDTYVDSIKQVSHTYIFGNGSFPINVTSATKFGIGGTDADSYAIGRLTGEISEVRIAGTLRSDAWIKAESHSLKNSLVTYSAPTAIPLYPSSGIRESGEYDVSGLASGSRVQWTENKPSGTNITVESNVSIDGGSSWLGWKSCTNGGSIEDITSSNSSNARLKLRQSLTTSNNAVTPSLSNSIITINFSKYVHRLTNAGPNKKYTVKFEIKDANGVVTPSTKDVYTKAQSPAFAISGSTDHSVDLLFSDANPATTEYQIMCNGEYANSSGVLTSVPTWIMLKNKSITILGLNIGTSYNFTAKARNGAEEETNISEISSATQGVPVPTGGAILEATPQNNTVTLGWNEIPNSLSYELEMDGVIKNVGQNRSYIHKGLMTNTQHVYRVRGRNKGGVSEWSNIKTVTTTNNLPLIPTNVVAKASNNSISVYWSDAQDALTYTVDIDGTEITDVSRNSACLFGLEPEKAYTYRVKACNLAGDSEWSETGTIITNHLITPEITQQESDSDKIMIGWDKVQEATSYQIALDADENFRTLYASDLEEFATESSIVFTHDNLPIRTAHVYRVRAVCGQGHSAWSDSVTLETLPQRPEVPTNFRGNASNNFITLIWDAVQDAIGYDLEVDGIVIENDNTPQYKYKNLDQYTAHTYRVRSVNSEIQSKWSDMLKIKTLGGIPDEPKNVVITNSRGIATLDWDKTPGALNYDVEINNNTVYTISKDTFVYRCVPLSTSSTTIYKETAYRIRAGNDLGKSDWTGYFVNNAIMAKVEKGKELDLGLTASNIMDFSKYTLYVNYNDKALTVKDLCAYSVEKELGPGMVEGHDIEIVSFTPGHIIFRVNKIINEGYLWTGIINNIKFTGNATGGSTITYTAQCSKD